ncbi:MAG: hypothetical protein K0S22_1007 [Oscillospiraceae bacterium]|nr:hypothetical protein [Oscillospiraceae bacterium]
MTEQYISSLSQYLSSIETLKSLYPTGMLLNNPIDSSFLYRGVCDSQYELLPGVFRKQTDKAGSHHIVNGKYLAWAKEKDLLFSFIKKQAESFPYRPLIRALGRIRPALWSSYSFP